MMCVKNIDLKPNFSLISKH